MAIKYSPSRRWEEEEVSTRTDPKHQSPTEDGGPHSSASCFPARQRRCDAACAILPRLRTAPPALPRAQANLGVRVSSTMLSPRKDVRRAREVTSEPGPRRVASASHRTRWPDREASRGRAPPPEAPGLRRRRGTVCAALQAGTTVSSSVPPRWRTRVPTPHLRAWCRVREIVMSRRLPESTTARNWPTVSLAWPPPVSGQAVGFAL